MRNLWKCVCLTALIGILWSGLGSCSKNEKRTTNCGCNNDSVYKMTYTSKFLGYENYTAKLVYTTSEEFEPSGWWAISVSLYEQCQFCGVVLKPCNADLAALRKITDTASKLYSIPVIFSGKVKPLCPYPEDSYALGFKPNYFPDEMSFYYITLDSLIKQ